MNTTLSIFHSREPLRPHTVLTDNDRISETLAPFGITYEVWRANRTLAPGATQADVLEAYADSVGRLNERHGYQSVDVVRLGPDHPDRDAFRAKFLSEHTHDDDEARFFVEGAGQFFVRATDEVYRIDAHAGSLIVLPKGITHWFDTGQRPRFAAIRFFTTPDGWVARFTGNPLSTAFAPYPGAGTEL